MPTLVCSSEVGPGGAFAFTHIGGLDLLIWGGGDGGVMEGPQVWSHLGPLSSFLLVDWNDLGPKGPVSGVVSRC